MENPDPKTNNNNNKRFLRRSSNSHISMSDTESTTSQVDSFHSPLRFDSPLRSDDPYFQSENNKSTKSLEKYYSPNPSPKSWRPWPHSEKPNSDNRDLSGKGTTSPVVLGLNRLVKDEQQPPPGVKKVGPVISGDRNLEEGYGGGRVDEVRSRSPNKSRSSSAALVFRLLEVIACLVSFSVMAADKTQGWSGDSYDRYKEYRYCLAVNIIGFVYAAFQAIDLAYNLGTEKHIISHRLHYHFGFAMDQILAYFLISASSSAATRVDDWITNWGKDEFTLMATASIAMSFLAFVGFALSSLISGYNLCNRDST